MSFSPITEGDRGVFAIESAMSRVFDSTSLYGLGYFVVHLNNARFGVYARDATALACSLDEVRERISQRGKHSAAEWNDLDAFAMAHAFRAAVYDPSLLIEPALAGRLEDFAAILRASKLMWAPDGDEAFDDGSYILQIDSGSMVRLIGFRAQDEAPGFDPGSLEEVVIPESEFYGVLERWVSRFLSEWTRAEKESVGE